MTPRHEDLVQLERALSPRHVPLVLIGGALAAVWVAYLIARWCAAS